MQDLELHDDFRISPIVDADELMFVYDHEKAVAIVKEEIEDRPDLIGAYAGLDGDWDANSDKLWDLINGFKLPSFHMRSSWGLPSVMFLYQDGSTRDGGDARISSHVPDYFDYSLGTRCCRSLSGL